MRTGRDRRLCLLYKLFATQEPSLNLNANDSVSSVGVKIRRHLRIPAFALLKHFGCELWLIHNLNFVIQDDRRQHRKLFGLGKPVHGLQLLV